MAELFHMNGYGLYIWSAYGAAFLILLALAGTTLLKSMRLKRERNRLKKNWDG